MFIANSSLSFEKNNKVFYVSKGQEVFECMWPAKIFKKLIESGEISDNSQKVVLKEEIKTNFKEKTPDKPSFEPFLNYLKLTNKMVKNGQINSIN